MICSSHKPVKLIFDLFKKCACELDLEIDISETQFDKDLYLEFSSGNKFLSLLFQEDSDFIKLEYTAQDIKPIKANYSFQFKTFTCLVNKLYIKNEKCYYMNPKKLKKLGLSIEDDLIGKVNEDFVKSQIFSYIFS